MRYEGIIESVKLRNGGKGMTLLDLDQMKISKIIDLDQCTAPFKKVKYNQLSEGNLFFISKSEMSTTSSIRRI